MWTTYSCLKHPLDKIIHLKLELSILKGNIVKLSIFHSITFLYLSKKVKNLTELSLSHSLSNRNEIIQCHLPTKSYNWCKSYYNTQ